MPNIIQAVYRYVGWLAGSSFFSKHLKHMFHPKHIAAVLIAMCLASTGDAASRLELPGAAEKMTIQPRGRAYLFRGFIGLLTDRGMDKLTERINRTGVTANVLGGGGDIV